MKFTLLFLMLLAIPVFGAETPEQKFASLKKAAGQGDVQAITALGISYQVGIGVQKNSVKAFENFSKASELGSTTASIYLASYYANGIGVKRDMKKAVALMEIAATAGMSDAQSALGILYVSGNGVPMDINIGRVWLQKSANQNDPEGLYYYAELEEKSGNISHKEAVKLFTESAYLGFVPSQIALSKKYFFGEGVPKDYAYSYAWANIAAGGDDPKGKAVINMFEGKVLSAQQVEEGQRLAREITQRIPIAKNRPD
ncbi:MAG: tetratricopeptide repeat protein [Chthoniobacterales bacterium]